MVKVGAMGKEPCCDLGSATFLRKANTAGKHIPAQASTERFGVKSDTENDTGLYCSVTLISGTSDKHSAKAGSGDMHYEGEITGNDQASETDPMISSHIAAFDAKNSTLKIPRITALILVMLSSRQHSVSK
ncbi:UNVERIFIED_CONTAM: hypothetical protein FKN15_001525 [Acipenser sinensis]